MKSKFKTYLTTGIICIGLLLLSFNQSNGQSVPQMQSTSGVVHGGSTSQSSLTTAGVLLYEQYDNPSFDVASQNFESASDNYDCQAADDFIVPAGSRWSIDEVEIAFSFNATLPTPNTNITVRFYLDNGGMPGELIKEYVGLSVNTSTFMSLGTIPLTSPVILNEGTNWISVVVNMDFATNGQFFWNASSVAKNNGSYWMCPGDGFMNGATTWTPFPTVFNASHQDLCFAIYGTEMDAVPFPIIGSILAFLGVGVASFFGLRRRKNK